METAKKKGRSTLSQIQKYPRPLEILDSIRYGKLQPYKENLNDYARRDRALVCLCYLLAARISEVLRLKRSQFFVEEDRVVVSAIKLSKRRKKDLARVSEYRQEAWLPKSGNRSQLTLLVLEYLDTLRSEDQLFPFGRKWAWRIIKEMTGITPHWYRAYGENYLYDVWEKDMIAVADYVKVDIRTLPLYIRRSYAKYRPS